LRDRAAAQQAGPGRTFARAEKRFKPRSAMVDLTGINQLHTLLAITLQHVA
jgi:hypothetical protein